MKNEETKPWERQHRESTKAFTYYQIFQELPDIIEGKSKTYQHIINFINNEQLIDNLKLDCKNQETFKNLCKSIPTPTYSQLSKYAMKWKWQERYRQYQNYQLELKQQQLNEANIRLSEKAIYGSESSIETGNKVIQLISEALRNGEISPNQAASALKNLSDSKSTDVKTSRLITGHSTENNSTQAEVTAEVTSEVDADVKVKITDDDFMKQELEFMNELLESKGQ